MFFEEGDTVAIYPNENKKNGTEIGIGEVKGYENGKVKVLIVESDELEDGVHPISQNLLDKLD